MAHHFNKAPLPATDLGNERCFQIGYFGHRDIFIATWTGPIDLEPNREDGVSTCFNLSHGSDLVLLASCVGYLRRVGKPEEEVMRVIKEAGKEVIEDDLGDMKFHRPGSRSTAKLVARGTQFKRFDKDCLDSLVIPTPAEPGTLDRVGGSALYTRPSLDHEDHLVYASLRPDRESDEGVQIYETADFCPEDVPTIATLICSMAMGEYRRDLRWLLDDETLCGEAA